MKSGVHGVTQRNKTVQKNVQCLADEDGTHTHRALREPPSFESLRRCGINVPVTINASVFLFQLVSRSSIGVRRAVSEGI
jgi:hypothetical protein